MIKVLTAFSILALAWPAMAQDAAPDEEQEAASPDTTEAEGTDAADVDIEEIESVLDDQTYRGEDDDFVPTEEIPVDEPIPFPSDI